MSLSCIEQKEPTSPSYALASFASGSNTPIILTTPTYPNTLPLSTNRNGGKAVGRALKLTPTGILVKKSGDYSVSFSSVLFQNNAQIPSTEFNIFLVKNGLLADTVAASSNSVAPSSVLTFNGGPSIAFNVKKGTLLSLVINNGVGSTVPIGYFSWQIVVTQLPRKPSCSKGCC